MNELTNTLKIAIVIWFTSAIFIAVASRFVLYIWLRRRDVRLVFAWLGTPGYLERAYFVWCRSQGRSPTRVLVVCSIVTINVIVAAVIFIGLVGR